MNSDNRGLLEFDVEFVIWSHQNLFLKKVTTEPKLHHQTQINNWALYDGLVKPKIEFQIATFEKTSD